MNDLGERRRKPYQNVKMYRAKSPRDNRTRPTRYPELGYRRVAPETWRIVDCSTDAAIGAEYRTRAELLADLGRYAAEFGCSESKQ